MKALKELILPSMQQQANGVNCSVYAIAFAVDKLHEFAEIGKRFDVRKTRLNLLECVEEEEFISFPRSHKHIKLSKRHINYVDIYRIGAHSMKEIWRKMKIC